MPDDPHAIIPLGAILPFAGELTSEREAWLKLGGWLPCDGRALDSQDPQYADLFGVIGKAHGRSLDNGGLQAGGFNLPDFRGRFLRGVAGATRDPGAATRAEVRSGGNTGTAVGSMQGDATRRPTDPFVIGNSEPATPLPPPTARILTGSPLAAIWKPARRTST